MKKGKLLLLILLSMLLIFLTIFVINKIKSGNNIVNQSADEIKKYILNMNSYETIATITINSNKNTNTYKIKQQYIKQEKMYKQEVIEPKNIQGVNICYDGKNLVIKNNQLNLSIIYTEYPFLIDNDLNIETFIQDYMENEGSHSIEKENEIILSTKKANNYNIIKTLYIDKKTKKITKMIIEKTTQKTTINIEYNEIKINSLQKEDILAFKIIDIVKSNI